MPALVIDNTVQFKLTWLLGGVPTGINVMHGIKKVPLSVVTQTGVNDLFTDIKAKLAASTMKAQLGNGVTLGSCSLRDLNAPNQPEYISTGAASPVVATTELLPLNVALCCTLRTDKAGASYRGRYFQGFWSEGGSANGVATTAVTAALAAWVTNLQTALDTAGLTMSVASRKLGISNAVTAIIVRDTRWDTQRRRIVPGI